MKKLLFIYNPYAGKSKIRGKVSDILSRFIRAGYRVEVYVTQEAGAATKVAAKRGGSFPLLVCSGGDGTLNEVVTGLMGLAPEKRPALGYIPAGTTNDFARTLELPNDLIKAAHTAVTGQPFPVDIGQANGVYFNYVFGFGAFTAVSYETPQELKKVLGHPAYLLEGARSLMSLKRYPMRILWEEGELQGNFLFGCVSNSLSVAGIKGLWGSEIALDDGLFEATLIREPETLREWTELMAALLAKDDRSPSVIHLKTSRIRFQGEEEIRWVKDGEFAGSWQEAEVNVLHTPLSIVKSL